MRKTAEKEDSGRGTYKICCEEAQSDTNEDAVEWISGDSHTLHKGKEKQAYEDNINCTRTANLRWK